MENRVLKYFLIVAREENITRAARMKIRERTISLLTVVEYARLSYKCNRRNLWQLLSIFTIAEKR